MALSRKWESAKLKKWCILERAVEETGRKARELKQEIGVYGTG